MRPATVTDVKTLVDIHITSWQAQFTPFLTAEQVLLKDLDEVHQFQVWQERLTHEECKTRLTFFAESDGNPVAYITGRDTELQNEAELHQIYVLPSAHRQGIGTQLLKKLAQAYQQQGKFSLFVWVMTINPAVAFYRDRLDGTYIEERVIPEGDGILKESKYRWTIEALLA